MSLKKRKKKKKPKLKSLSSLKKKAWVLFSQYIRQSSADNYGVCVCYTCGERQQWKEAQAGHAIPGRHNAVLYDEEIVRVQCVACNIFRRGNYQAFITKLIKSNGIEWWENKLSDSRQTVKYTRTDIQEIIDKYTERLKAYG